MEFEIERWRQDHDSSEFTSSLSSIKKYIQEQAPRAMSSGISNIFVLVEKDDNHVRGYYSLSSTGLEFDGLPKAVQRQFPKYPLVGGTLLGRLGVDEDYRNRVIAKTGENPRLGELLLIDAQRHFLIGAQTVASAYMLIDVEEPCEADLANGARDPMPFYLQYGFRPLPATPRRVFKLGSTIRREHQL